MMMIIYNSVIGLCIYYTILFIFIILECIFSNYKIKKFCSLGV